MNKPIRKSYDSPDESFAARTQRFGRCLVWIDGALSDNGYGLIWNGERVVRAHVYAWERVHGPVPEGRELDHTCHNRLCCEVSHLRLTTRKQNMENLSGPRKGSPSGVRGVSWDKSSKKWRVRVKHNYQEHYGGMFLTVAEAEVAAIELRNKLFTHNNLDRIA